MLFQNCKRWWILAVLNRLLWRHLAHFICWCSPSKNMEEFKGVGYKQRDAPEDGRGASTPRQTCCFNVVSSYSLFLCDCSYIQGRGLEYYLAGARRRTNLERPSVPVLCVELHLEFSSGKFAGSQLWMRKREKKARPPEYTLKWKRLLGFCWSWRPARESASVGPLGSNPSD